MVLFESLVRMVRRFLLLSVLLLSACAAAEPQPLPTLININQAATSSAVPPSPTPEGNFAGLLDFWEPTNGSLQPGSPDVWRFIGAAGDQIIVRVLGAAVQLTLQDETGDTLIQGTQIQTTLPASAAYTLLVEAADGLGGPYEIGLGYTDRPNPAAATPTLIPEVVGVPTPIPAYANLGAFIGRLTHDTALANRIEADAPDHIYTFDGQTGQFVQLEMLRVSGEIDPVLTLYDPEGVPVAMDSDSGGNSGALLRNVRLPVDGIYSVQASSGLRENDAQEGAYSIRLLQYEQRAPVTPTVVIPPTSTPLATYAPPRLQQSVPGNLLESHVPVTNILLQPSDVAVYPLYADAGQFITVGAAAADPLSGLGLVLEMSDPDGVIVATSQSSNANAGGDALIANFRTELAGTYTVFLRSENQVTGQYILSYGIGSTRQDILQGEARFGERIEAVIDKRGLRHIWTLELRAGDVITAAVNAGVNSALDPIIELVPANALNVVLAEDDNGGGGTSALLRDIRIAESGIYLLRIRAAQAASFGSYALIWRYVNVAPTSTVPPGLAPVLRTLDNVPENEYRFYPFQGRVGQRVQIRVLAQGGTLDPVAALIGPDGRELVTGDDSSGSLNPQFTFELTEEGTYNVRVNGYLSGGAFEVIVEEVF
ncbi:MAG: hypothetical protein OHK0046_13670 [Anaerolineae bacterium]